MKKCTPITFLVLLTFFAMFSMKASAISSITGPTIVCTGSTISLHDSTSGGIWSSSSAVATVNSAGVVSGISSGTATITYTLDSVGYVIHTVTVDPSPASISGTSTACIGGTTTLTDGTSGGTWSISPATVATVSAAGVIYGVSAGTATVTYALSTGCYADVSLTVTSGASAGTISGPSTVCVGGTATLTDGTSGGIWSSSSTLYASVSSGGVVTGVSAGVVTISYAVTSSCGSAVATHVMTVTTSASAGTISGGTVVCVGSTIPLSDSAYSGGSWTTNDSTIISVNGLTGATTGLSTGTGTVTYWVYGSCGTAYTTHTVTVDPTPAAITGTLIICPGGSTTLADGTSGGTWSSSALSTATIGSSTGIAVAVGVGTTNVSYTLGTGCAAHAILTVTTTPTVHAISGASTVCVGGAASLSDSTSGGSWSSSNVGVASVSSTGLVLGVSAGVVTITYTISSSCGTAYAVHTMTISAATRVAAISGATSVCVGATITLTDSTSGGSWTTSDSAWATVSSAGVVTGSGAGTVYISYTYTGACGTAYTTYTVTVNPRPTITAGSGVLIASGGSATLTATGGSTYTWAPPATLSASTGASVVARPTSSTTYTVTGTSSLGCKNTAVETVTVSGTCATPTGLSITSISTTSAIVNWSAVAGATEYFVAYKASSASTWTDVLATGTSRTLTGLTAGTSYQVKLRSICGAGDSSSATGVDSFTTLPVCGTPTTISSTSVDSSGATIDWSSVTGASSYILAYKTAAASSWTLILVTGTSHTITGLLPATIYEYEIRSICGSGDSSSYTGYSTFTTTGGLPVCPTPTGLTSVLSSTVATLSWTAVPGAMGYMVTYQLVTRGTPTNVYTTTNSVRLTGLSLSSSYEYKVRSVCDPSDTSSASPYTTFRDISTGITDETIFENLSVYPNPTRNSFVISYHMEESAAVNVIICNTLGQTVAVYGNNEMQESGDHEYAFTPASAGFYIVRVMIGNNVYTEKVVKY